MKDPSHEQFLQTIARNGWEYEFDDGPGPGHGATIRVPRGDGSFARIHQSVYDSGQECYVRISHWEMIALAWEIQDALNLERLTR